MRWGVLDIKSGVGMRNVLNTWYFLGNEIMGACFQASHAAPGQRPMETIFFLPSFIFIFSSNIFFA